jgi:hypothetical protein
MHPVNGIRNRVVDAIKKPYLIKNVVSAVFLVWADIPGRE